MSNQEHESRSSGFYVPWPAIAVILFLIGHLGTAIWFARGVKGDVESIKDDVTAMVEKVEALVEGGIERRTRLEHLEDEVERLRRYHESTSARSVQ